MAFVEGWLRRFAGTLWLLLKVLVPVYAAVGLLQASGWLVPFSERLRGPLGSVGIVPEAVLPLVIGLLTALYGAIGSMASVGLSPQHALPVVLFLNFAHALPIEVSVAARCGVNPWKLAAARIGMGVAAAAASPLLLPLLAVGRPDGAPVAAAGSAGAAAPGIVPAGGTWTAMAALGPATVAWVNAAAGLLRTVGLLVLVLAPLTLAMEWLERRGILDRWATGLAPSMGRLGLSGDAAFAILAGLFLGLVYGAGVIVDRMNRRRLDARQAWRIFLFLGACHSLLEDPFTFSVVGVGPHVLLPVRLVAGAAVLGAIALANAGQRRVEGIQREAHANGSGLRRLRDLLRRAWSAHGSH
ncbi:hypothetical protein U7230_11015 [Carboxydochorda subterranea]|uniref:Nucleoside recognition protein n=1 Tax=Carboxydichorda subterranea TaxID=3109565 RepID=A0ABZ1BWY7_9FIRM|nr:hypothetical protein [Limnochorda sp. L945t]WRP16618.1 hypothetical protein U7230_11015 [Limnochorda sp. L945t]